MLRHDAPETILILHGPNLNLFGRREPHIYGTMTLDQINERLRTLAAKIQVKLNIVQSNHEGVLVDTLQKHMDEAAGAILNPGALTQYGVSLHDCIKAMPFPVIEVHLSNLATREEWRHRSIIAPAVKGTVGGLGWRSYTAALRTLVEIVREKKQS
ncbi:MAG TPA: type II 3-dehydroquinate dehydratase [Burkholderiales bacterium]|jgi:3-dehydroquinate dehydratase-2|nr:type II 3-dehydroquinate dehydratase [Burkholderiales bacterium]